VSRRRVNLRGLSVPVQYLIGIAVAVLVGALAWQSGRQHATAAWVDGGIKIAGTVLAVVVVGWLAYAAWRRLRR
jgi:hypothetical protein